MSITKRFKPSSDDIMELVIEHEMLRLNAIRLLEIVKRTAYYPAHKDLTNDAIKLLQDLGEAE